MDRSRTQGRRRAARAWRIVRTALAFGLYGGGALAVALAVPPLRWLGATDLAVQRGVYRGHRFFVAALRVLDLVRLRVEGAHRLAGPGARLLVANHPTLFDAPLLGALLPQADFVVKGAWADHPVLRGAVAATGYLRDDGGPRVVAEAVRRLRAGRTLVMFPEGTRSPEGEPGRGALGRFQRGAAHMALGGGCDLWPVVIEVTPRSLRKGQKWYDVPERTMEVAIRVLEPLAPGKLLRGHETPSVAARVVTAALRDRLEGELHRDR